MGKKDLKNQHKNLFIDIIDIIADLDPSSTNKFLPLLIKEFKSKSSEFNKYVKSEITHLIGTENLRALKDFNMHLNHNRTEIKDISQIKDFKDLHEQLVFAELKLKNKDLKKEVKIIHKDSEWLIIKPLSYESSKVYGAGTKWCTSSREDDKPFYNYSNDGVLLYVIRLGTDEKFGVHWYFEKQKSMEMSWWDIEDRKVDSLTLNIPPSITQIILQSYLNTEHPNSYYFKNEDKVRAEQLRKVELETDINIIPIDFGLRADVYDGNPEPATEPQWTLYEGNTTTTLDVDGLVNKSLEYTYMAQAMKKSLEDLDN